MTDAPKRSERGPGRRTRWILWLAPPICFGVFVWLHVDRAGGWPAENLFAIRWDVGHYRDIAASGYEVFPCRADRPDGDICGNPGWMFGWPLLVRAVAPAFGGVDPAIRWLPPLLTLASFATLFALALRIATPARAILVLLGLAAFPGSFYLLTGFPYAFTVLLQGLYLLLLYTRSRGSAIVLPILAAVISTAYTTAFLFALVPAVYWLREAGRPLDARAIARVAAQIAPFAVGPLAICAYFWVTEGDPLLFLKFQSKYQRTGDNPIAVVWTSLTTKPLRSPENVAFLWFAVLASVSLVRDRAGRFPRPELAVYVAVLILFSPATGSMMSIYRHLVLAWPALIVLAASPLPSPVSAAYLLLGAWLSFAYLLPRWLRGTLV